MSEEIIVEIDNAGLHPVFFNPLPGDKLRPRWVTGRDGRTPHESLARMPVLFGIRLGVDIEKRRVRKFDPLATTADGRAAWEQAKGIMKASNGKFPQSRIDQNQQVVDNCSDGMLKTWLHWIRVNLDIKDPVTGEPKPLMSVIQGTPPSAEAIARMPGRVEVGQNNKVAFGKEYLHVSAEEYSDRLAGAGAGAPLTRQ